MNSWSDPITYVHRHVWLNTDLSEYVGEVNIDGFAAKNAYRAVK